MHSELFVLGDALGVLQAVLAKRARCPDINMQIAEMNLILAATPHELTAAHVWSEENALADALSRLQETGDELPALCRTATEDTPKEPAYKFVGKDFADI